MPGSPSGLLKLHVREVRLAFPGSSGEGLASPENSRNALTKFPKQETEPLSCKCSKGSGGVENILEYFEHVHRSDYQVALVFSPVCYNSLCNFPF